MFMLHSCRTLPFFLYCCKRNIAETVCIIYHMPLKAAEQQHQHKNSKNARFNQKSDMKTRTGRQQPATKHTADTKSRKKPKTEWQQNCEFGNFNLTKICDFKQNSVDL